MGVRRPSGSNDRDGHVRGLDLARRLEACVWPVDVLGRYVTHRVSRRIGRVEFRHVSG